MSSRDRVSNNLVALGSAAALAVFAVGFVRTQAAAERLEEADVADEGRSLPAPTLTPDAPPSRDAEPTSKPSVDNKPTTKAPAPAPVVAAKTSEASTTTTAPDTAPVVASQPVVAPVAPAPAAPDSATKAANDSVVVFKDGVYFGWGTSRHGDIQMGVEIKSGRIASAFISECYTQYPCSWVSHLPKQVVERQSADVDYVSGATQSANALYRAVVNALKQAK